MTLRPPFLGVWVVVGTMGLQGLHAALFANVFGVYVVALTTEFAWSTTLLASGFALMQLQGGLLGPLQGVALDRFGPRRVALVGVAAFALGLVALASVRDLVGYFAALALVGFGVSASGYLTQTIAVARWFTRARARAMAFMALGASIGGTLVPLVAGSVTRIGWRATLLLSALALVTIGGPMAALLLRDPSRYGTLPDGAAAASPTPAGAARSGFTLAQALRTRAFWAIGIGHGAALLVVSSVLVHLVPHLTRGFGLSLTAAAGVVALLTVVTAIGQVVGGYLGDRFSKRLLAIAAMFAHAGALLALAWLPLLPAVGFFLVLHGLAWGVRGPLMGALRADYFGLAHFGAIMGASTLVFMAGQLAGPVIAGVMADAFGDYRLGFTLLAALAALGSVAFALAGPPDPPQRRRGPSDRRVQHDAA
jgi:MFS family permease